MPKKLLNPLVNMVFNSLIWLPSPSNISIWWNFGSIMGLCLMIQIISGLFLSMHYCPSTLLAFKSIIHIIQDIKYGWLIRNIHMNGASFYFICIYIHIARGIYYHSFNLIHTWLIGVSILLLSMMAAFLGYVLPWGQMSFWGATVITNLLTAIPYFGKNLVIWIWGDFAVDNATLNRFFSLHFIIPLIISILVMIHLMFLHKTGSNNPLGLNSNLNKIPFHPYFSWKDFIGFMIIIMILLFISTQYPYFLSDPDNFTMASCTSTPKHIQPEWYFLFAYSILRAIPNKLGGVIGLLMAIMVLSILPFNNISKIKTSKFYPPNKFYFWILISSFFILTWTGMKAIETPFTLISQINSMIYFSFFLSYSLINKIWDSILMK